MESVHCAAIASLFLATLVWSCSTKVPPAAVAWDPGAAVLMPAASPSDEATGVGYLRVDTDRDIRVQGSLSYDYIRRPYDIYDTAGTLVRANVPNQGWRNGEEPVSLSLPAGRYVVASMYGTTYRKVQVEVVPGETTEVTAAALSQAPAVFH